MNNELIIPIIKLNPIPNNPLFMSKIIPLDSKLSASASFVDSIAFTTTTVLGGNSVSITVGVPLITVDTLVLEPGITFVEVINAFFFPGPTVTVSASVIVEMTGDFLQGFENLPI